MDKIEKKKKKKKKIKKSLSTIFSSELGFYTPETRKNHSQSKTRTMVLIISLL